MIWLTWRQHRMQALAGAIGLAAIASFLLATGPGIASAFKSTGLAHCLATPGSECGDLAELFSSRYNNLQFLVPLFLVVPMLIGVFWGAPLVAREIEQGTHRMAWTQGVTRRRWFATKAALIGAAAAAGAAGFAALVTWWSSPLVKSSDSRFGPGIFDLRGIVPIGYVLFAFALGVAAGAVMRKTLPAMAATLGGFVAVRAVVDVFVRPHYMTPKTVSYGLFSPSPRAGLGDWVVRSTVIDPTGQIAAGGRAIRLTPEALNALCPGAITQSGGFPSKDAVGPCLSRLGVHVVDKYQPGSRYWLFQSIELTLFIALAAGLIALAMWWVRRRIS
jgi:ABC-2 family transporter protein